MDMVLTEEVDENEIIKKLNETAPSGIKYLSATAIPYIEGQKKVPQSMALIDAARYIIKVKYKNLSTTDDDMNNLLKAEEWKCIKKSKKGEREVNIKPMVKEFTFWIKDDYLVINALISTGSRENLSADLLACYIKNNVKGADLDAFVDIKREEMYFYREDGTLLPLYKCVSK